jgi:hypothetical protein
LGKLYPINTFTLIKEGSLKEGKTIASKDWAFLFPIQTKHLHAGYISLLTKKVGGSS